MDTSLLGFTRTATIVSVIGLFCVGVASCRDISEDRQSALYDALTAEQQHREAERELHNSARRFSELADVYNAVALVRSSEDFTTVEEYNKLLFDNCVSVVGRYNEYAERTEVDEGFEERICSSSPPGGPSGEEQTQED